MVAPAHARIVDHYDPPRTTCPLCERGPIHRRLVDFRGHNIDVCGPVGSSP